MLSRPATPSFRSRTISLRRVGMCYLSHQSDGTSSCTRCRAQQVRGIARRRPASFAALAKNHDAPLAFGRSEISEKRALPCAAEDCPRWLCWHCAVIANALTRGNVVPVRLCWLTSTTLYAVVIDIKNLSSPVYVSDDTLHKDLDIPTARPKRFTNASTPISPTVATLLYLYIRSIDSHYPRWPVQKALKTKMASWLFRGSNS